MHVKAITFPKHIARPRATVIKMHSKRSFLKKCRHIVEFTDWDEKFLAQEKWVNKICLGVVITSALYFIPVLIMSLLK